MSDPRLPQDQFQERVLIPFSHAQLTAGFGQAIFSPTLRNLRVKSGKYRNPTGLAAHGTDNVAGTIKRAGAADALTVAAFTFTTTHGTETVNATAHGLLTGDGPVRLTNSGGALPAGYSLATDYYIIKTGADSLQLAATRALAFAGTAVAISGNGTGTHTMTGYTGCKRPVTVATIFDTDSDNVGYAAIGADAWIAMALHATDANAVLAPGDSLWFVVAAGGSPTLPLGAGFIEAVYG